MARRIMGNLRFMAIEAFLRVGLIGAGWVTQHHLAGWAAHRGTARVVAIADPNLAAAPAHTHKYGIAQCFASAEEMLAHVELDAVDIAAPREPHPQLVRLAADRDLAV